MHLPSHHNDVRGGAALREIIPDALPSKHKKPEEQMFLPVSILSSAQLMGIVAMRRRRT